MFLYIVSTKLRRIFIKYFISNFMNKIVLVALLLSLLFNFASAAFCHGKPGEKFVNNEPVWRDQPRLLRTHSHGKLF